jgi:hypothetical protein
MGVVLVTGNAVIFEERIMTSRTSLSLLVFAVTTALSVAFTPAQQGPEKSSPVDKLSVEDLIKRLGSEDYKTRESATGELLKRDDARSALLKAAKSKDPEVSKRAKLIFDKHEERASKGRMKRLLERIKNGQLDEFIDQMVFLEKCVDSQTWLAVLEFADAIVTRAKETPSAKTHAKKEPSPDLGGLQGRISGFRKTGPGPTFILKESNSDSPFVKREIKDRNVLESCTIISQRSIQTGKHTQGSIIFANGDINLNNHISSSLVICDGSITIRGKAARSILIATGKVKLHDPAHGSSSVIIETPVRRWAC